VAFGEVVIDVFFYGFRTLGQTKGLTFLEINITILLLFLVIFDLIEMWVLASRSGMLIEKNDQLTSSKKSKINAIHPGEEKNES
jgi:hypothetical protein